MTLYFYLSPSGPQGDVPAGLLGKACLLGEGCPYGVPGKDIASLLYPCWPITSHW